WCRWGSVFVGVPDLSDGNLLQFALAAIPKVNQGAYAYHRREHGRKDADGVHDGEAPYGPATEGQQGQADNKGRQVGVDNRAPSSFEPEVDGLLWRQTVTQFFSYSLVYEHV